MSAGERRRRLAGGPGSYMFRTMYWPLIGGFVAFVLISVLMGWIMDPDRHGDGDGDRH